MMQGLAVEVRRATDCQQMRISNGVLPLPPGPPPPRRAQEVETVPVRVVHGEVATPGPVLRLFYDRNPTVTELLDVRVDVRNPGVKEHTCSARNPLQGVVEVGMEHDAHLAHLRLVRAV